jgi:hypothetical protein
VESGTSQGLPIRAMPVGLLRSGRRRGGCGLVGRILRDVGGGPARVTSRDCRHRVTIHHALSFFGREGGDVFCRIPLIGTGTKGLDIYYINTAFIFASSRD